MALNTCVECKGELSTSAKSCPHCGHPSSESWGACPECKAGIAENQLTCTGCGFPLKPGSAPPVPAPAPRAASRGTTAVRRKRMRRPGRGKKKAILGESPEPAGAMIFAVLGLFVPVLAIIGLCMSKKGSGAFILSCIDIGIWILSVMLLVSTRH